MGRVFFFFFCRSASAFVAGGGLVFGFGFLGFGFSVFGFGLRSERVGFGFRVSAFGFEFRVFWFSLFAVGFLAWGLDDLERGNE